MTGRQNSKWLMITAVLAIVSIILTFSEPLGARLKDPVGKFFRSMPTTQLGLDIRGGVRVTLQPDIADYERKRKKRWDPSNLETVRGIIEKRVNVQGVSEPEILTKPSSNQIVVSLPGLKDEKEAIDRLQSTASLQFYLLPKLGKRDSGGGSWSLREGPDGTDIIVDVSTGQPLTDAQLKTEIFDNEKALIATGDDMRAGSCTVGTNPNGNAYINFEFDPTKDGSRRFEDTTRAFLGSHLAIFLDKKLLTAPTINGPISGKGIIEGNFTLKTAKSLADQLNAGALPVPLTIIEIRKLEATLGAETVVQTTRAGVIGLVVVILAVIFYYRLPGMLASVALVLYTLFSYALFKVLGVTLTLPGIAGFILSIGMAVDANILIFERLKEELREGKTLRTAIDAAFKRAFSAIFDSNVCTLITCSILYYFGTGPIRGFALTLGLGVLVSMFTAITVSRSFLFALVNFSWAQTPGAYWLDLKFTPQLNVSKRKMFWLGLSVAIIIPGLIFMGLRGLKPAIDFTGGTEIQIPYAQRKSADAILDDLKKIDTKYEHSRVVVENTASGQGTLAFITMPQLSNETRDQVINGLTNNGSLLASGKTLKDVAYSTVSGTISSELTWQAILSVLLASTIIVIYLAFRFAIGGFKEGLKYGLCAVAALIHDVLVLLGMFAILGYFIGWQIDTLFVTAMLTVIGFSVHDTIIVFDRIRENLNQRQKGEDFGTLTDRSVSQTFARSINTSMTVLITLLALFLFGGGVIRQFVGALLIGIISGTYSSIFNASVLLAWWKSRDTSLMASAGKATGVKSGLVAKETRVSPGDKPVMIPKPTTAEPTATTSSKKPVADDDDDTDDDGDQASKPQKLKARRKRRM